MVELQLKTLLFPMKKLVTLKMNLKFMGEITKFVTDAQGMKSLKKLSKKEGPHFFVRIAKNVKKLVLIPLLFIFASINAEDFVDGLGDIPNFKDMKNVEDSFVLFDKIDGRYLYSETEGYYNKKEISKFYNSVLPNLGWVLIKENKFERADEVLEIKFEQVDKMIKALFSISPKNN